MPSASNFQPVVSYEDVTITIASSTTVSNAIDLHGCTPVGIFLPSTFDGTTIKFQAASAYDGTYVAVEDGASSPADVVLTATAASKYIAIPQAIQEQLRGIRFLKVVTGSAQTTTNTVITLALRPI
ncbi:MAG: hypothetical protein K8U57_30405 [Planctomycetes bacterium]|nr:hypothetical protein [Planctomycetota bacterium]